MQDKTNIETNIKLVTTTGNAKDVFKTFLKLGLTSFGGPVAHLGYFRKELVDKQRWISESQFSQLVAICQFLPGPASSQLGFTLGLLRAGWLGAFAAFLAFTLPSALLLIGFASAVPLLSSATGEAIIHGLKLVAFAVVADAVWGMAKKLCPDITRRLIAALAVMILLFISSAWSQILVVIAGAITGAIFCRTSIVQTQEPIRVNYSKSLAFVLLSLFLALLAIALFTPNQSNLVVIAQAFYQAGALVFGGGHVVLPLLQDTVVTPGLVSNADFLAGYGASQAIPGPMFAFSAYLGAMIPASSQQLSFLGASIALVCIFLPGFLLVTVALPFWQSISHHSIATHAIMGVNAAVVGLLVAALYDPIFTTGVTNLIDLAIGIIGFLMLSIWRLSSLVVVFWCVITSVLLLV